MTILKKDAKLPPPPISSTIAEIEIGETITNLLSPGWLPLMSGMTSVAQDYEQQALHMLSGQGITRNYIMLVIIIEVMDYEGGISQEQISPKVMRQ